MSAGVGHGWRFAALAVVGALLAGASPSAAQTGQQGQQKRPNPNIERQMFGDWQLVCVPPDAAPKPATGCRIDTLVWTVPDQSKQQRRLAMAAVVHLYGKPRTPVLVLRLPPVAAGNKSVKFRVDDNKPLETPPMICNEQECQAAMSLPPPLLGQFKAGLKLVVSFALGGGRTGQVAASLSGFTKAFGALETHR